LSFISYIYSSVSFIDLCLTLGITVLGTSECWNWI